MFGLNAVAAYHHSCLLLCCCLLLIVVDYYHCCLLSWCCFHCGCSIAHIVWVQVVDVVAFSFCSLLCWMLIIIMLFWRFESVEKEKIPDASTTCCIVVLDGRVIRSANMGDSGFMLIRKGNIIYLKKGLNENWIVLIFFNYKSEEMERHYNCPHSLGGTGIKPELSWTEKFVVQKGDWVILATVYLY